MKERKRGKERATQRVAEVERVAEGVAEGGREIERVGCMKEEERERAQDREYDIQRERQNVMKNFC